MLFDNLFWLTWIISVIITLLQYNGMIDTINNTKNKGKRETESVLNSYPNSTGNE